MHILIAPNAFKNSLSAGEVASAIETGLITSQLKCTTECFPIADGGDGTGELIVQKCGGEMMNVMVHDPLGGKINASFGLIENGHTAIIEMANASGIRLLKPDELNPLEASSLGTGELILAALDAGARKIILTLGGSATVDGGMGILSALGVQFLDEGNDPLTTAETLVDLAHIEINQVDQRITDCEFVLLCDVDNPLLGEEGAASVFGPQKGATPDEVLMLEESLTRLRAVALREHGLEMDVPHGGAAGGVSAGLHAFLGASLVNGIDEFIRVTSFEAAAQKASLIITGEGSLDEQTLRGKGPMGVAVRAKALGIPVIGLAGKVPLNTPVEMKKYFQVLLSIGIGPGDVESAMKQTRENLIRIGEQIGHLLSMGRGELR